MEIRIAYRPMFSKEWITMSPDETRCQIVPCEYALVIDGERTIIKRSYASIATAAKRVRQYQGNLA